MERLKTETVQMPSAKRQIQNTPRPTTIHMPAAVHFSSIATLVISLRWVGAGNMTAKPAAAMAASSKGEKR